MRKNYITPIVRSVEVENESLIALSMLDNAKVTSENEEQFEVLGREDNSSLDANIWDQGW